MVGQNCETAAFQKMSEVSNSEINGEEFTIECAILPLGRSKLFAEER